MSDIVERLRSWVYTDSLYATAREAADEIERLRHRVRFADAVIRSGAVATLTEAERDAVETAACEAEAHQHLVRAATLRALLSRLCRDGSAYTDGVSTGAGSKSALTDEERLAIQWVVGDALSMDGVSVQETLRGLLERLK